MNVYRIHALSIIEVEDHKTLLAAWKSYGREFLVKEFIVRKPLTDAQYRRLPQGLKDRLKQGDENNSVAFLEELYRLSDPRTSSE